MGFLKFLKKPDVKGKELYSDELEMPPPPESGSFSSDLPSFVGSKFEGSSVNPPMRLDASSVSGRRQKPDDMLLDKLPELKPFDYGGEEKKATSQQAAPGSPFQQFEEMKPEMPSLSPMPWDTLKQPTLSFPAPALELPKPAAAHEALKALQFEPAFDKPVFISASKYRQIIEDIDHVLGKKGLASETTALKDAEEREYEKLGSCLEDMQRKLMFVDKSLFEV